MIKQEIVDRIISDVSILVVERTASPMAVTFLRREFNAFIRGLRALSDFEYEFQRALLMKKVEPRIETVFIMTSTQYSYISSTGIRELACFGGKLDDMVPDYVEQKLKEKFADKYNA